MTSTVKANLKPCPFCGGHATLIYDNQEGYRIYCDDCDIMTDTDYGTVNWMFVRYDKNLL